MRVFYGPKDNLQAIDTELISRARETIDMAAFVITNRAITDALGAAARRGVKVRIYLTMALSCCSVRFRYCY